MGDTGWMRAGADTPPQPSIDTSVPHSARIWNYWLGGKDNYPVDREAGDRFRETYPAIEQVARASRAYLVRVITFLAGEAGIRQFLDIGTGLPTADNTHQIAQRVAPNAKVLYVDNDPLVLAHAHALLTSTPQGATTYIEADLSEPEAIIAQARTILDLDQPIAVNLSGVLGHIADLDEGRSIVRRLAAPLAAGSYLAISDGTRAADSDPVQRAQQGYNTAGGVPYNWRTPQEIATFFTGLDLVPPGLTPRAEWRAEPDADRAIVAGFGGVGRKP